MIEEPSEAADEGAGANALEVVHGLVPVEPAAGGRQYRADLPDAAG